ncbi:phage portal protein [Bacillus licheniformis]|nr:phage portal protein [Bacillus licheniformis]MEC2291519.1 phage portal protein [Bacillus licheniformis]
MRVGFIRNLAGRFSKRSFNWFQNSYFNYGAFVNDDNILKSSDTYNLMKLISDQVALTDFVVEDGTTGRDSKDPRALQALRILNCPNDYLTGFEFKKLLTNVYLLRGDVYVFYDQSQLHILNNAYSELTAAGTEKITVSGEVVPSYMVRHIKNIGLSHLEGVGLLELAKETLEGVMNAEKALTEKYKKGGLMAFLLKLETHLSPTNTNQTKTVKAILDQLEGIKDSGETKLIPLGRGYEIEALESPVDDEKTLKYLNIYKKDLGKFFGMDKDLLDKLEEKDMEQAMMKLYTSCLQPIFRNIEEHLTILFFGKDSGLRLKFRHNLLNFVGMKTKTEIAYNLVRTSIAVPDDAREMIGFPRLNTKESSKLYISKDLVGLDRLEDVLKSSLKGGDEDG